LAPDALGALFDLHAHAIFKYALRFCQNAAQADQIVGLVFAQLAQDLQVSEIQPSDLRLYLFQLSHRFIAESAQKDQRPLHIKTSLLPRPGPELENADILDALNTAVLQDLSPEEQQVVILRFMEGFGIQETASIMAETFDQVNYFQSWAIARLRMRLNGEESESLE
jgi:RNA polymerase sigma-70 factor (ECF subfamily)